STGNCRTIVWRGGVMTALEPLTPAHSTLDPVAPTVINSRGQIVGLAAVKSTGDLHGFLLTPMNSDAVGEKVVAAPNNISESRKVVIPENVRRALQRMPGSRRDHIPGLGAR